MNKRAIVRKIIAKLKMKIGGLPVEYRVVSVK